MKKKIVIAVLTASLALGLTGCGEKKKYASAMELMNAGSYEEAITAFQEIPDYEDVPTQINECHYLIAENELKSKNYDTAIAGFEALADYKDSAERVSEAKYTQAGELFEKLDFEAALALYKEIPDYENAADMIEKCEYELSVDGQFMRALADGLMARWDYTDDPDNAVIEEDVLRKTACDKELEKIDSFAKQQFDSEELDKVAKDYIATVQRAKESLKYYTVNYSKYSTDWSSAYEHRVILLEQLRDNFGLTVDEKHQSSLDGLMEDVAASKERVEIEKQINKILDTIKYSSKTDEWGYTTYTVSMKNVSDYTFEYLSISVNVENADEVVVSNTYLNVPNNWAAGKKYTGEVYFGQDIDLEQASFTYDVSYTVDGFYGEM